MTHDWLQVSCVPPEENMVTYTALFNVFKLYWHGIERYIKNISNSLYTHSSLEMPWYTISMKILEAFSNVPATSRAGPADFFQERIRNCLYFYRLLQDRIALVTLEALQLVAILSPRI